MKLGKRLEGEGCMMSLIGSLFSKKPKIQTLDSLYLKLYNRQHRMKRWEALDKVQPVPVQLIEKEKDLIAAAEKEIADRLAMINQHVVDREAAVQEMTRIREATECDADFQG